MKLSLALPFMASISLFSGTAQAAPRLAVFTGSIFARKTTTALSRTCGNVNFGNKTGYRCPPTAEYRCCSQWGWCGSTDDYCGAGCQPGFGDCNDLPNPPEPKAKSPEAARLRLGSVPIGIRIDCCTVPGTVALAFDDGPFIYTDDLLDILAKNGVKATFFVNGHNWGDAITNKNSGQANIIQRMDREGHQIASHTWSHANLSTLAIADVRSQMSQLEIALFDIIGKIPTYMRPPYLSCNAACFRVLEEMGYHVIYGNLNTMDWVNNSPKLIQASKHIFNGAVTSVSASSGKWLIEAHDVHQMTVKVLAQYMLDRIKALGYKAVTVGECLADPKENWYRSSAAWPIT